MGQTISSSNFFFYGKKHFTQSGYLRRIKSYKDPVQSSPTLRKGQEGADDVDLTGRVVVITGANSGLGKELATYVAAKGATLYMLCRSATRGQAALEEIQKQTDNDQIKLITVDVSELSQVRKAVQQLQEAETKIDAVVCNAGVLLNERQESSEGNESTFASHLLGGTYLLGKLLMPLLEKASEDNKDNNNSHGGRIVIVTSGGMYNYKLPSWEYLSGADHVPYDGVNAYAYAKRAQVLVAEQWSTEFPRVQTVTAHPGWSDTPALAEAFGEATIRFLKPLRSPWQGAEGIAWLVSTPASKLQSGELYLDRMVEPKHIAGPFFREGTYTKNTPEEVQELMKKLKEAAGV